jgi:hypothetical protein
MPTQNLSLHYSKLEYASFKKMIQIINDYTNLKNSLTIYFPNIDSTAGIDE